jgi:hypothetical protein
LFFSWKWFIIDFYHIRPVTFNLFSRLVYLIKMSSIMKNVHIKSQITVKVWDISRETGGMFHGIRILHYLFLMFISWIQNLNWLTFITLNRPISPIHNRKMCTPQNSIQYLHSVSKLKWHGFPSTELLRFTHVDVPVRCSPTN